MSQFAIREFAGFFALAFSALFPVINPLGSSLVFLGMVGEAPAKVFRTLAGGQLSQLR